MPILKISKSNPFVDGRQSERAFAVQSGMTRHFEKQNWVVLPELTLSTGRRADLVALSPKGRVAIVEIKSSIEDFMSDSKWPEYRPDCDYLYFATLSDVPKEIFPEEAGLFVADAYGAELLRETQEHPMTAARRKNLIIRFARTGSQRLTRCASFAGHSPGEFVSDLDG